MDSSNFPTIGDYGDRVQAELVRAAVSGLTPEIAGAIAEVFTSDPTTSPHSDTLVLNLMVYARGCHEMSKVYSQLGQLNEADLYHAIGQDMLDKAMEGFGFTMARQAHIAGAAN